MLQYRWPGNVRQLENALFYAVNMSTDGVTQLDDLPDEVNGLPAVACFDKENSQSACSSETIQSKNMLSL